MGPPRIVRAAAVALMSVCAALASTPAVTGLWEQKPFDAHASALEARVLQLEAGFAVQQETIDRLSRLLDAGSDCASAAAAAENPSATSSRLSPSVAVAANGRTAAVRGLQRLQAAAADKFSPPPPPPPPSIIPLSVCVAIPCIPRHLVSLRLVLEDITRQTLMPAEVVVALSQTSAADGAALELELAAALGFRTRLSGALSSSSLAAAKALLPVLRVLPTLEAQTHAENNNRAAGSCSCTIVSWFDADDRMHPRRTEVVESAFRLLGAGAVLHGYHTQRDALVGLESDEFLFGPRHKSGGGGGGGNAGDRLVAAGWPGEWPAPVLGAALHDLYAASEGGFDSYVQPAGLLAQHGHVSVHRDRVLLPPASGGLGLAWEDVDTGGQRVGEDVRFVKACAKGLGRRDAGGLVLVPLNLTLYQPSWGASKRCVLKHHILFDCVVREPDPRVLGDQGKLDFSSYDTVFACPVGTQPGLYLDESDFSKGVRCVAPSERAALAPGVRYLDGLFDAEEESALMPDHLRALYDSQGVAPSAFLSTGLA